MPRVIITPGVCIWCRRHLPRRRWWHVLLSPPPFCVKDVDTCIDMYFNRWPPEGP